jgi:hypothetical protein
VLGVVGPTWPAELVAVDRHGLSRPLTYGLAPRLAPAAIATPEPFGVRAGGVELPCELWHDAAGKYAGRAGVAWLEDDSRPPRYGELEPLFAALAARGVAVLRCHGRGTDGFGRRLRLAADGDRTGAALADCDAALAALRGRLPRAAPIALAGEGAWRGAAALAFAGRAPAGIARVLALFPAADPLAPLDALAAAGEPARSRGVAAWGDPESAGLLRARAAWAAALESARTPTWVVTGKRPLAGELAAERVSAAATAGAPVELLVAERSRLGGELLATAANELAERLATELARGSRTPPERR